MLKKSLCKSIVVLSLICSSINAQDNKLYQNLQDISVTVKAGFSEGSGVIVTRDVRIAPNKTEKISFVWTAGHVVDGLRSIRTIIRDGQQKKIVEFKDAQIVKEFTQDGRRVGELKMDCKVLKYSDAEDGEDLALLMIRQKGSLDKSAVFHLPVEDKPVPIGTELYHVGSLLGQTGSNSMTRGIMSQVGRVLNLGTGDGVIFDQTTVTAFPGSSGGGVFLSEQSGDNAGKYVGMLVRGAGETFNLIVPARRMKKWAKEEGISWAIDANVEVPTLSDIMKLPVEGGNVSTTKPDKEKKSSDDAVKFPTLIQIAKKERVIIPILKD
jgi:hypothetical protein